MDYAVLALLAESFFVQEIADVGKLMKEVVMDYVVFSLAFAEKKNNINDRYYIFYHTFFQRRLKDASRLSFMINK